VAVTRDARTPPGLVVYRFAGSLYYANANHLLQEVGGFVASAERPPLTWFCIDAAALPDIDFTGAQTLRQVHGELHDHGVRPVIAEAMAPVRKELDRYGLVDLLGADAVYDTVLDSIRAFEEQAPSARTPATVTPEEAPPGSPQG